VDSPFSHTIYYQKKSGGLSELNYPLISDLNQSITRKYKLLTNDGLAFRFIYY
jgi:alkyl hydroperoxide reductase subunit AhpC